MDGNLKFIQALLILLEIFTFTHSSNLVAAAPPTVRVMVEKEIQGKLQIEGYDLDAYSALGQKLLLHADKTNPIELKCHWSGSIALTSLKNKKNTTVRTKQPIKIISRGGYLRIGSNQYRDELFVYAFQGDCMAINHVDLEKYVAGLLNSEMNAGWNIETLKAQAVAARTYALHQMKESSEVKWKSLKPPFDLDSSIKDQVYEGAHQERDKALRAVKETRGKILTYNGQPIKAFYHSTCGGQTEATLSVWGVNYPYIRPVKCGYCNRAPLFHWTYSIPVMQFEKLLSEKNLLKGNLLSLTVTSRNERGRAGSVQIRGTHGLSFMHATKIRAAIGGTFVRSTDFVVSRLGNQVVFRGMGSGHGVGMCQWGAKVQGDRGRNFTQILKHYYPDTQITALY